MRFTAMQTVSTGWLNTAERQMVSNTGIQRLTRWQRRCATLLVALLTVSFQAVRAALANPVKALRSE